MGIRFLASIIVATFVISGCSTSPFNVPNEQQVKPSIVYKELFVRGVFNWWEAEERFQLQDGGDGIYSVKVELIADGQPYDFKLADAIWSPHTNCGFETVASELIEGQWYTLYCGSDSQNMQFIPNETGRFFIQVKPSNFSGGDPVLSITQI
ncbi:hypothetical protein [Alteromonas flava]|uniref:hypothetical protein n=1 Tax=Alteromonas flava TaxID=2048003 RepID=UPI000C288A69|nr:hypothetical protein [Alteromonas flava]